MLQLHQKQKHKSHLANLPFTYAEVTRLLWQIRRNWTNTICYCSRLVFTASPSSSLFWNCGFLTLSRICAASWFIEHVVECPVLRIHCFPLQTSKYWSKRFSTTWPLHPSSAAWGSKSPDNLFCELQLLQYSLLFVDVANWDQQDISRWYVSYMADFQPVATKASIKVQIQSLNLINTTNLKNKSVQPVQDLLWMWIGQHLLPWKPSTPAPKVSCHLQYSVKVYQIECFCSEKGVNTLFGKFVIIVICPLNSPNYKTL